MLGIKSVVFAVSGSHRFRQNVFFTEGERVYNKNKPLISRVHTSRPPDNISNKSCEDLRILRAGGRGLREGEGHFSVKRAETARGLILRQSGQD